MGDIDFIRLDSSVKDGGQRIELDVVAGAADVASCMDEFYACMARVRRVEETQPEARLRALEGLVGAQDLAEACRDFVLNRFTAAAVRRLGLDTVLAPGVHADDVPRKGEDFSFAVSVTPRPALSLSSIGPVHVKRFRAQVEEADIQEQLAYAAERFATLVPADHDVLQEGDWALVDVDMMREGKRAKDLSGVRRSVEFARGLVPEGLLEGVLGMRAGEMRKVEFSVGPASGDAPVERYKADVTLRQVQRRLVPAIDDAWVAENLPQFETLEGFRRSIAADLEAQSARVERQDRVRQVRSALAARLEGSVPDEMYQQAKESLVAQTCAALEAQGKSLDAYLEEHGTTQAAFNVNAFLQASEYLRQNLALDVLARERGLWETQERGCACEVAAFGRLGAAFRRGVRPTGVPQVARRADTPRKGARLGHGNGRRGVSPPQGGFFSPCAEAGTRRKGFRAFGSASCRRCRKASAQRAQEGREKGKRRGRR